MKQGISRRSVVIHSLFGTMAVGFPNLIFASKSSTNRVKESNDVFHRYPSIDDELVNELVGVSHFNLDRVKEIVEPRPELARACCDWGFGDWETALGAASHVGRRDIAEYLIGHGARPDLFTFAMLGQYDVVKASIEAHPGIQSIMGPHGISLLRHAKAGLRQKDEMTQKQIDNCNRLIEHLEMVGGADYEESNIEMTEQDKEKYVGDYKYGDGEQDGFTIGINMRDMLMLGKLGKSGGSLYQVKPGTFSYNGIRSVRITFEVMDGTVKSLMIKEPDFEIKAIKV